MIATARWHWAHLGLLALIMLIAVIAQGWAKPSTKMLAPRVAHGGPRQT
ncbi:MAG: hypothetical protein ACT4NL_00270 [Pseudomarimonas sp.]